VEPINLRILFVEKDPITAGLLVPSLEQKRHEVFLAHTQQEALSRPRSARPDLLIFDVASFGLKGYDICSLVRGRLPGVPTILLLEQGHDTAGSTADGYMTPPFTSRKLLYRIRSVALRLADRMLQIGPMRFDPQTRILYKGEESLYLRPKEAMLLMLFMGNRGRVLSRQELIRKVWLTDFCGDTRTLNVHVRWLRLKIEADPKAPRYLRTVRGVGYRFDIPDPPPPA